MSEKFPSPFEFLNEASEEYIKYFVRSFEARYGKGSWERTLNEKRKEQKQISEGSTDYKARTPSDFSEVSSPFKQYWNNNLNVGILERNGKYIGVCVLAAKEVVDKVT